MKKFYCQLKFVVLVATAILIQQSYSSCTGCIELDEITFDKVLKKFQYSLVKFDIAFPYGPKHEAFGEFALKIQPKYHDQLLIALVGIKDYGEKENTKLGQRFNVNDQNYPQILLFSNDTILRKSTDDQILARWPQNFVVNFDNIKKFIRDNTHLYIGLDGCLKKFDLLATEFMSSDYEMHRQNVYIVTKKSMLDLEDLEEQDKAKVYVLIMEKVLEKGTEFLNGEQNRLQNLMKSKVSENKKLEMINKINVLKSFEIKSNMKMNKNDEF